jgi:origin recognition complex subunit 2
MTIVVDGGYIPPIFVGDDAVTHHITNIVDNKPRSKKSFVDSIDFSGRALLIRKVTHEKVAKKSKSKEDKSENNIQDVGITYSHEKTQEDELTILRIRSGLTVQNALEGKKRDIRLRENKKKSSTEENIYKKVYITNRRSDSNHDSIQKNGTPQQSDEENLSEQYDNDFEELLAITREESEESFNMTYPDRTSSLSTKTSSKTTRKKRKIGKENFPVHINQTKHIEVPAPLDKDTLSSLDLDGEISKNNEPIVPPSPRSQRLTKRKRDSLGDMQLIATHENLSEFVGKQHDTGLLERGVHYQSYFDRLYHRKGGMKTSATTSHHTLEELPEISNKQLDEALRASLSIHEKERQRLMNIYSRQFGQWYSELHYGFNLLMYGFGSKRRLLLQFAKGFLSDGLVMMVDGFHPACNYKQLLDRIMHKMIPQKGGHSSKHWTDQSEYLRLCLNQDLTIYPRLYLVIHNIDGLNLRSDNVQTVLSLLASIPKVHLVASVDHIHADFMWDAVKIAHYNWIWHAVPTFEPYAHESSYETSIMAMSGPLGLRGISHVLRSLTSNAQGIFRILATDQLESPREPTPQSKKGSRSTVSHCPVGLAHDIFLEKCRETFLVNSEMAFRSQLTEFLDHKIFVKRRFEGTDYYSIPLDSSSLTNLLGTIDSETLSDEETDPAES